MFEKTIREYLDIKSIVKHVKKLREECLLCQTSQAGKHNYGMLTGRLETEIPMTRIATDIYGPVPTSNFPGNHEHNKFWIVTVIDRCTRWTRLRVVYDITPETVIKVIKIWLERNPTPLAIQTYQGKQYMSSKFKEFLKEYNINH